MSCSLRLLRRDVNRSKKTQRSLSLNIRSCQLSEVQTRSDAIFGNLPCPDSSVIYLRLNQISSCGNQILCGTTGT